MKISEVMAPSCALFLFACSMGGGSFEVETLSSSSNSDSQGVSYNVINNNSNNTNSDNVFDHEDEVGYVISHVHGKKLARNSTFDELAHAFKLYPDAMLQETTENKDKISIKFPVYYQGSYQFEARDVSLEIVNNQWKYLSDKGASVSVVDGVYYEDTQYDQLYLLMNRKSDSDYQNTMLGYTIIQDEEAQKKDGSVFSVLNNPFLVASIFYKGFNRTADTEMPIAGKFTYAGHWLYLQQLSANDVGYPKVLDSDLQMNAKSTNFTVDFANKSLTGKLAHEGISSLDYTINADIRGALFSGVATGKLDNIASGVNGTSNANAVVKGAFYGAGARELAGRAIANDNSWAAVFAAVKTGTDLSDSKAAGVLHFVNGVLTDYQGIDLVNINTLIVDGERIVLNDQNSCCSMMQFMRYGAYQYEKNGEKEGGYFVQGIPTSESEMPQTGTANYRGQWYGYATDLNKGNVSANGLDASFTANWANKTLTGGLYTQNQTINSSDPAIQINATINGASFSGTAEVDWAVDTSTGNYANAQKITGQVNVVGQFYGADANELGGHFLNDDKTIGGVFAGKQIQ